MLPKVKGEGHCWILPSEVFGGPQFSDLPERELDLSSANGASVGKRLVLQK